VGLCNAFSNGGLNETSTAYAALAEASGGEGGIEAYCATVAAPGDDADETEEVPGEQAPAEQQVQQQRHGQSNGHGAGQGQGNGQNNGAQSVNNQSNNGNQSGNGGQPGRGQR